MLMKVLVICGVVATSNAGIYGVIPESHGSSYSVISHGAPDIQLRHSAPTLQHHAPTILSLHHAPLTLHAAPTIAHHNLQTVEHHSTPIIAHHSVPSHQEEHYDPHPKYSYKYGVSDHHTGDHKSAEEQRDGDVVKGSYMLLEPDGTTRIVKYTADHKSGFNAIVEHHGKATHPQQIHNSPVHQVSAIPVTLSHSLSHGYH